MTSTLGTVAETTEIMTDAVVHDNPDERPVKSKRTASDRLKTGRASTHPVVLDPAAKRARLLIAADPLLPPTSAPPPPPPPARRNASCLSTIPGECHRPTIWSGVNDGGEWRPCDDPYEQQFAGDAQYDESWRCNSYRCPAPLHDNSRWDEHTPLLYDYQPSSPFRSSLHVPPRRPPRDEFEGRQQTSMSSIHFQDFNAFRDAVQREIQRVSLSFR
jgi:hypothetical protein